MKQKHKNFLTFALIFLLSAILCLVLLPFELLWLLLRGVVRFFRSLLA